MRKPIRIGIALGAVTILVWRALSIRQMMAELGTATTVRSVQYNDAVQDSIGLLVEQSSSWSQLALLLLGVLAALWIAKRDEVRLALGRSFWPEIVMWMVGVSLLLVSVYCHVAYVDGLSMALEVGGLTAASSANLTVPDVFGDVFDQFRREQFRLLALGAVVSLAVPFSVWNLKGVPHGR